MPSTFFPVVLDPANRSFDPTEVASQPSLDLNDLTECADQLGTTCPLHRCARFIDEAPLVYTGHIDGSVRYAKNDLFPHSWTGIATHAPAAPRGGWFSRSTRPRTVTVRFCPKCRSVAEEWLRDYLAVKPEIPVSAGPSMAA